ncbi:DUF190 domain-containing protein [Legionella spiritensis]|uniref:Uncharacterized protein n=1 Tax=Legionella spiritensis TaxID=452 RepID=A0A0W0Z596_LEGSP|nr:DUF190 domain-containing protein [Legionella spiritensis]KTD64329.1 hypothetical protein Lspi_1136 [Legionella spiritensis]SNV46553.1 Uncharacterized ACR, COG1993 [Legionella spiritensis]
MKLKMTKISVYINEADQWQHRPLHLELLKTLHQHDIAGGTVIRAVAGFTNNGPVETTSLVDIGSQLPLIVQCIDVAEKIDVVLPEIKKMAASRLIVREEVEAIV